MKKTFSMLTILSILAASLTACSGTAASNSGSTSASSTPVSSAPSSSAAQSSKDSVESASLSGEIMVISRESGSGTRGAFIELFGVEEKDASGNKTDKTTEEAAVFSSTDVVLQQVAGNQDSIGYISLGSLNDTVKALDIDGSKASSENIKSDSYKIARPFNIATKGEPMGLAKDFVDFILSAEGQKIISKSYIAVDDNAAPFAGSKPAGKIVIAGSSSVSPVMEKLREGYLAINSQAAIEIQQSDSSAGIQALADGTCDIGMASRALKESEAATVTGIQIALDGIAVIVNKENPVQNVTSESIKSIYTGAVTDWADVK